jgi:aspartate/methionine/tyrosine aminotransferase
MSYKSLIKLCEYYYSEKYRFEVLKKLGSIITLSSGINHLPCPQIIKNEIASEFKGDRFYTSYTDHCGSKLFLSSLAFEIKEIENDVIPRIDPKKNICRTFGATGGLSTVLEYLGRNGYVKKALVLGLNYSVFTLWCDKYSIKYRILRSKEEDRILPLPGEVIDEIKRFEPDLIILTQPTNPSGEIYDKEQLKELLEYVRKADIWFLYDDVPNMYNPYDSYPVHMFEAVGMSTFPHKWIIISSFSKCRSLAGLRYGYVISNEEIFRYLYKLHDVMFWSTQHTASGALSKDILLRILSKKVRNLDESQRARAIKSTVKHFSQWIKLLSPYSHDMACLEDNFAYLAPQESWEEDLKRYENGLKEVYNAYTSNWNKAQEALKPYMTQLIKANHGFNHCFKINSTLTEIQFCTRVFEETGIDFYTESVFDQTDDLDRKDFYIRMSCAIDPLIFDEGLDRLLGFMQKYCCKN